MLLPVRVKPPACAAGGRGPRLPDAAEPPEGGRPWPPGGSGGGVATRLAFSFSDRAAETALTADPVGEGGMPGMPPGIGGGWGWALGPNGELSSLPGNRPLPPRMGGMAGGRDCPRPLSDIPPLGVALSLGVPPVGVPTWGVPGAAGGRAAATGKLCPELLRSIGAPGGGAPGGGGGAPAGR